ncbi:N-acetylmuramic acid 6-phosphate etherase, partial [Candidatus Sumerlaeota bacterium]|nr:N-acetylmuramic acid 6-phosphate etherase [Candidatus Sumerlaeota bacterium]
LSCTPPLEGEENLADCQIHALVGPEPITGSTRMKSGTVTKLILNQITTISMIQLGKVYENLMVDLKPTNSKLVDRARRILAELTGLSMEAASQRLEQAGNDLKTAVIMSLAGCPADTARSKLLAQKGHVAAAIRSITNG